MYVNSINTFPELDTSHHNSQSEKEITSKTLRIYRAYGEGFHLTLFLQVFNYFKMKKKSVNI